MITFPKTHSLAIAALLLPWAAVGQTPRSAPVALPLPVPTTTAQPEPAKPALPTPSDLVPALPTKTPIVPAATTTMPVVKETDPTAKGGIMMNFQGASLSEVLNYLSEAAGFVIVQEVKVDGTVNVVSRQPVSPDEAVDLVNAVLIEKGYIAMRNGRILKIVSRKDAQKRDLPVMMGSDPAQIPRKDEMVTQILPLRYGEAGKLIENLRPLLAENATISANDSSNSILLTDTQINIRRIAQIIRAIDTSVASISTIHIYPLRHADAKELASVITQLFVVTPQAGSQSGGRGGRGGGGFGGFAGFGIPGGPGGGAAPVQSEAKQAESRVVAVADEQSNSLIVSASEELIPAISDVVEKLDTSITEVTETRIFRLLHADATELATLVGNLYGDTSSQSNNSRNRNGQNGNQTRGMGFFGQQPQPQATSGAQSERAILQAKVVAVGDPRTNSLIITAARDTMMQISETIGRLDATDAKKQRVYVHSLEHADADTVANVLRGMLGDQSASTSNQQAGTGRLSNRSATGATMDTSDASSNTGRAGGR